ncbi:MAG: DinB family protein [Flavobacteriales bacterium]|nr:DinB family protein [Flavobacteriales bacterium]
MKRQFIELIEKRLTSIDEGIAIFENESIEVLSHRASQKTWSVLENIEHLHRYNDFYIEEFWKSMKRAQHSDSDEMARGRFGMKSAKSMLPTEEGVTNPMKTFRSKNPHFTVIDKSILETFRNEQEELKRILEEAKSKDIGGVMCRTTLPLIRFHLCDALEFVINHQVRHIAQAKLALKKGFVRAS